MTHPLLSDAVVEAVRADMLDSAENGIEHLSDVAIWACKAAKDALTDAGYVVVPKEPTEAMVAAYFEADDLYGEHRAAMQRQGGGWLQLPAFMWKAMLTAAEGA